MSYVALRCAAVAMAAAFVVPVGAVSAQMADMDGSEIVGQPLRVETAGVTNTVYLNRGGTARIIGSAGQEAAANWSVQGRNLCLTSGSVRECWPYQAAFQSGQPIQLTSDCGAVSRWTALSTNRAMTPPVQTQRAGERG